MSSARHSDMEETGAATPAPEASPDLALLGHDIRSAVSDVLGGLRLIEPVGLPEAAQLQIARARAAAESLARLLDTALADSSLGDPAALADAPESAETPLLEVLDDAERRWAAHARDIGMTVIVTHGPGLPALIGVGRTQLERILSNLLSNAIKYSGKGTVRLDVTLDDAGTLGFAVRDEGAGFAPQVLDNLYDRGVRAPGDPRGGHGMGLHICKDLADRMGGALYVASAPTGACVRLELPTEAWQLDPARARAARQIDLTGKRALLIEDSPTNQVLIGQMLQRLGAEITVAGSGEQGLKAWQGGGHDLALIDIELPGMSGLDVIREIRAMPGAAGHLPVLAVTAYVLRSNREAIFAAGADGVLAKPLASFGSFAHALQRLMRRADPAPPQADAPQPSAQGLYDRATLQHLFSISGPQGAEELLTRLKADLRSTYTELSDGLSRADIPVIRAKTHVLISLAGAIGARECQMEAEQMNEAAHRRDIDALDRLATPAMERLKRLIGALAWEQSRI